MILYGLAGFTMKVTDEGVERKNILLSSMFFASGLSIGVLFSLYPGANMIFAAIVLGTAVTGKIDNIYHLLGLLTIISTVIFLGIPKEWNITVIFILTTSAILDEIGDYFFERKGKRKKYLKILRYRPFLKIVCIIFVPILKWNALGILIFDFSYEMAYFTVNYLYSKDSD